MKMVLKISIFFCGLFICMQASAQPKPKTTSTTQKSVKHNLMEEEGRKPTTKTKTVKNGFTDGSMDLTKGKNNSKTRNNMLVTNENISSKTTGVVKKPTNNLGGLEVGKTTKNKTTTSSKSLTINSRAGGLRPKSITKTPATKTVKHN